MRKAFKKDDSGVSVMVEYLMTLAITMVLFTIFLLFIQNTLDTTDRIALKEEFDIISNDVASRISAFSSENNLAGQSTSISNTVVDEQKVVFSLPQLVNGKQYNIKVDHPTGTNQGTVTVTYVSNSNIYSTATFYSDLNVKTNPASSFNSQPGQYSLTYDKASSKIILQPEGI
jgi:hypothetical protein